MKRLLSPATRDLLEMLFISSVLKLAIGCCTLLDKVIGPPIEEPTTHSDGADGAHPPEAETANV